MSTATADPAEQDSPALIRHILDRYHTVHRREMPELIRLARRVEVAHRDHPEALTRGHAAPEDACGSWRLLYDGTRKLAEELVEHIRLENDVLFARHGG